MRNMVTRKIKVTKVSAVAAGMINKELAQIPLKEQSFIGVPKDKKINESFAEELATVQKEFDGEGILLIVSKDVTENLYGIPTGKFVTMAEIVEDDNETETAETAE